MVHRGVHIVVWQGHHRWPQHPVLFHDLGPGYARVLQPMGWMNLPSRQHALELPLSGEAFLHCGLSSRTKRFCTNLLDLSENKAPPIPMYYCPFSYKNCHLWVSPIFRQTHLPPSKWNWTTRRQAGRAARAGLAAKCLPCCEMAVQTLGFKSLQNLDLRRTKEYLARMLESDRKRSFYYSTRRIVERKITYTESTLGNFQCIGLLEGNKTMRQ